MINTFLNPEGHQNRITGSKVTAILLKVWILPIGGASAVEGLRSTGLPRLVYISCVTYHVWHVTYHIFIYFLHKRPSSQWRVWYQQVLTCLILKSLLVFYQISPPPIFFFHRNFRLITFNFHQNMDLVIYVFHHNFWLIIVVFHQSFFFKITICVTSQFLGR